MHLNASEVAIGVLSNALETLLLLGPTFLRPAKLTMHFTCFVNTVLHLPYRGTTPFQLWACMYTGWLTQHVRHSTPQSTQPELMAGQLFCFELFVCFAPVRFLLLPLLIACRQHRFRPHSPDRCLQGGGLQAQWYPVVYDSEFTESLEVAMQYSSDSTAESSPKPM